MSYSRASGMIQSFREERSLLHRSLGATHFDCEVEAKGGSRTGWDRKQESNDRFGGFEGATGNPIPECYTARRMGLPRAGLFLGTGFHREVTMEQVQEVFQGTTLYLTVIWGVVTAIFLILVAWRSVLSSHEDDQIFIDAAQEHMAREQRELVAKIESLSKPLMASGITSGVLLLLIAGIFVYHGLKNF